MDNLFRCKKAYMYCNIENKHIFIEIVPVKVMRKLKDEAIDRPL